VNPLRWTIDDELSARVDHRGAVRAKGAADLEPAIVENAVTARCSHGVLEVERPSAPELQADNGAWRPIQDARAEPVLRRHRPEPHRPHDGRHGMARQCRECAKAR
jgi:hypothetical protein